MRKNVFSGFAEMYPDRFINVTNGIAVRRWLKQSNPGLSALLTERLGFGWENDLEEIGRLIGAAEDPEFRRQFRGIKRTNKQRLADEVMRRTGVEISVDSLFDVQVKRIHEYKRQLLNLLYVVTRYNGASWRQSAGRRRAAHRDLCRQIGSRLRDGQGDHQAHQQCRAHHRCRHPSVRDKLRFVFLPDYDVSLAQKIMPAADLSQQISTAGMEASGTGNMKLSAERRADHRHAGRCQYRDSRPCRRGERVYFRAHGGRSRREARRRLRAAARDRGQSRA
jgi:glycogen phosphorylase